MRGVCGMHAARPPSFQNPRQFGVTLVHLCRSEQQLLACVCQPPPVFKGESNLQFKYLKMAQERLECPLLGLSCCSFD